MSIEKKIIQPDGWAPQQVMPMVFSLVPEKFYLSQGRLGGMRMKFFNPQKLALNLNRL